MGDRQRIRGLRSQVLSSVKNLRAYTDETGGIPGFVAMRRARTRQLEMATEQIEAAENRLRPPVGATALVLSGFYEGLEVCLDRDRLVIGRERKADLVLAEATVSRAHAVIGFDGQAFYVEDLGSTNGTLVNGARITKQPLKTDDEIQMGKLRVRVTLPR